VRFRRTDTSIWCFVSSSSGTCDGVQFTVTPFVQGSAFDPWQGAPGTGAQPPVEIAFGTPVRRASVAAVDPTFAGTLVDGLVGGGSAVSAPVLGNGQPGVFSVSPIVEVMASQDLTGLRVTAAPSDYVSFMGLTVWTATGAPMTALPTPAAQQVLRDTTTRVPVRRLRLQWQDSAGTKVPRLVPGRVQDR
jgi:hypothetical protein